MPEGKKLIKASKILLIIALAVFVLGNALAILIFLSACDSTSGYSPEIIQDPLATMAIMGMRLASTVGSIAASAIGDILSIIFASVALGCSSKACLLDSSAFSLKTYSTVLLYVSIISFLITTPVYFILSAFIGI